MATASRASELKQQGALEAARDPNSTVTAQAAEDTVLEEAKKGGSAALQFDPDATPEEKAAQARSVRISRIGFIYNFCVCQPGSRMLTVYDSTFPKASTIYGNQTRPL